MKNSLRITTLAAVALLLQGCIVEIDSGNRTPSSRTPRLDRPPTTSPLLQWGESCSSTLECDRGLHCMEYACEPERIGIYPEAVLVSPGRADGLEWDDDLYVPRWIRDDLASARRGGLASLFDFMRRLERSGISMPDPYGYGYLAVDGWYDDRYSISLAERGYQQRNVFHATWPQPTGWTDVPFSPDLAVAFDLYDEDRYEDEAIGFIELDHLHLRDALYQGGLVWFDTWAQTDGQVLLFGMRVVPES